VVPACELVCPAPCTRLTESECKLDSSCRADYCNECSCQATFVGCVPVGSPPSQCPALACPTPICGGCNGLDEKSCLAAKATLGCTATYCPDCHGSQTFSGCLGPNQGQGACPACPANTGRSSTDCTGGQLCVTPGGSAGCGVCTVSDCTTDANCSPGLVCEPTPCACDGSGHTCTSGCQSPTDCREGQTCSNHHCVPLTCTSTAQCPKYFECVAPQGSNGTQCARIACIGDGDCGGGYCIDGECYATLGICEYPPPVPAPLR